MCYKCKTYRTMQEKAYKRSQEAVQRLETETSRDDTSIASAVTQQNALEEVCEALAVEITVAENYGIWLNKVYTEAVESLAASQVLLEAKLREDKGGTTQ